jgi:hypothetical protein
VRAVAAIVACGGWLAFGAAAPAAPPAGHVFTVREVKAQFRAHVAMKLVTFAAASTPEVTSLRTRPHSTPRLGDFQLFVLHGRNFPRLRRLFTHGVASDSRDVYWVPDRTGGWIAVTLYDRNLVVAWFPTYPSRELDDRWVRLQRAISLFARRI